MRHRSRLSVPILALIVLTLLVAACGSAGSAGPLQGAGSAGGGGALAPEPAEGGGRGGSGTDAGGQDGQGGSGGALALRDDAKIVRTGSLELKVGGIDEALGRARTAIDRLGGYVGASRVANDGEQSVAQVTYRVPTDRWDEALAALRGVAVEVLGEQTDAVEVTGQLVDLEARIANLRASERALQAIAEKATRIQDVLDVQARLTDVRGQIEQLTAQKTRLDDQVGYGTLTVTFGLEVVAVTEAARGWNAGEEVDRATATLVDVLQALASAGIWVAIVWLPVLVMLGAVALVVVFVLRRLGVLRRADVVSA